MKNPYSKLNTLKEKNPTGLGESSAGEMPEYLKKVYEFFKANNAAKDVLIGSVSFIAGGFVLDRILRRDEDQDED